MTIAITRSRDRFATEYIAECAIIIERSNAHNMIEEFWCQDRGAGGRPRSGTQYSLLAVLVISLALIGTCRAPSMAEIFRRIWDLDGELQQRLRVELHGTQEENSYSGFAMWLTRKLAPLDSLPDIPARRVKNSGHRKAMASRTLEQQEQSHIASERLHLVVNALVAASIHDVTPDAYRGDIVADETIIDLAGQSHGLGSRDEKRRGAAYAGAYYIRDRENHSLHREIGSRRVIKGGVGIGVTAISRIGAPGDVYGVAPVITAVSIGKPSSGSVEELERAIRFHQQNGLDRRSRRGRLPLLTVDMGSNVKKSFNDLLLSAGYAPVVRYPTTWRTVVASDAAISDLRPPGAMQVSGDFYCPAARAYMGDGKLVQKTQALLEANDDSFERHDARIEKFFPLLMGTNSRPYRRSSRRGRLSKSQNEEAVPVRIDLVCPAVQGRVRCPLKPGSFQIASPTAPQISPNWTADRYKCCAQSSYAHEYSEEQWKRAQWGLVPGSWEHATYYETARSVAEQRFSIMKSTYVTGMENLKRGVRREPMLGITIGLWIAATNLAIQESYSRQKAVPNSTEKRMGLIADDIGRTPVKIPPRT